MVKKITSTVIVLGLVAGFPGVLQAASPDFNIVSAGNAKLVHDSKITRTWRKQADRVYRQYPHHYQQSSNGITVSSLKLDDTLSRRLLGKNVQGAGLQALLLTVKNDTKDLMFVDSDSLSIKTVDEQFVLSMVTGDISYFMMGLRIYGISFGAIAGLAIVASIPLLFLYGPADLAFLAVYIGYAVIDGALVLLLPLLMVVLLPLLIACGYCFSAQNFANTLHDRILNPRDQWAIYPGQRLDRIIFVYEDTNVNSFTLKLHGKSTEIPPFFVMV